MTISRGSIRDRARKLITLFGSKIGETGQETAYLGKGDGTGQIISVASPYPRSVFVYNGQGQGRQVQTAVLAEDCAIPYENNPSFEHYPVQIGYPANSKILTVLRSAGLEGGSASGGKTIMEQLTLAAVYPSTGNILDFRLAPETPASSTKIFANAGWYVQRSTNDEKWFGGDSIDIATTIAALNPGEHRLIAISLDTEATALIATPNAVVVGTNKDDFDQTTFDALVFAAGEKSLGAVHIYFGHGVVDEVDIYRNIDPRFTLRSPSAAIASATYHKRATMWHEEALVTAGNPLLLVHDATQDDGHTANINTSANGDVFTNSFMLRAGTYKFTALGISNSDRGKIDWAIDGATVISGQDWYSAAATRNVRKVVGSISVATDGYHKLTGTINGRNASNTTAYLMVLTKYWFTPSAD